MSKNEIEIPKQELNIEEKHALNIILDFWSSQTKMYNKQIESIKSKILKYSIENKSNKLTNYNNIPSEYK